MIYLVVYDIVDDRKRAKIAGLLKDYGFRVQKSVYECRLEAGRFRELRERLGKFVDCREDSIIMYPLCADCRRGRRPLGIGHDPFEHDYLVL
ncbi:MAG: CRISPR-associated endonuclease Cas2 [Desulfobulbaceae bacterium]|nr:CRISPR-associated endonuclease Cas2 [Desulfobulbaceae bacterium]